MIGQLIGQYKIIEKLGEGGMGVVYKAEDTRLKRLVALKFLPQHLTPHDSEKARFLQEAQSASALNHPNVCTVYDIKEENGQLFIVMECVDGVTLRGKTSGEPLALQEVLAYAIQIGDALHEAHTLGIVHRDIKCENIMVNTKNQIKVMDFGLAKLKGSVKLTRTSSTVGTLAYMAPEQIQGGDVDARSDIFSYGVVLFELLTRRMPFRGDHDAAMMYAILHEEPEPVTKFRPELSSELDRIVHRALEKEPEDRYQHIDDMVSELRRLQKQSSRVSRASLPAAPASAGMTASAPVPVSHPATPKKRWTVLAVALGAAVVLAAAAFYFLRPEQSLNSLAVLPFVNVGADPNTEYLSDGMTESIINSLTRIPELRVVPRSTVFRFKGKDLDPQDVAGQLKVAVVLTGRVVHRGDELNVQLDLIDVEHQSQIWGEQYRRKTSEVLALQEEIVGEVSRKLRLTLSGETQDKVAKRFTENPDAYKLYLQGRYFWNKRRGADILKAAEYLNQAIAIDPGYALAYAALADCYLVMEQYAGQSGKETNPKARAAAQKALELDPSLSEARTALAFIRMNNFEWEAAEQEFKAAIALNPKYPTAYHWYSIVLGREGRRDESFAVIQKALELDPLSPIILLNVAMGYAEGKDDTTAALQYFQKGLDLDATFAPAYYQRGRMRALRGMFHAALPDLQKAVDITGRGAEPLGYLGFCYGAMGSKNEGLAIARELEAKYASRTGDAYNVARAYVGLGDREKVFEWLERAVNEQSGWLTSLRIDREWDRVRDDPRFTELLKRIGLDVKRG